MNADAFDSASTVLTAIADHPETPKAVQRACLIALEKIDVVSGYLRRADLQARMDSLKKKPAPVTPINKASG